MKNFIQPGNTITLAAPAAVTSGSGLLVGAIFGIAAHDQPAHSPATVGAEHDQVGTKFLLLFHHNVRHRQTHGLH